MKGVLLVTGGSRGIGAAICQEAGSRGYAVAVNFLTSQDRALSVVNAIRAGGGKAVALKADMTKEEAIVRMFAQVDKELGPVTALVNNAGGGGTRVAIEEAGGADLERIMSLNLYGAIYCAREAVRRMSTRRGGRGGAIVNISSMAAKRADNPGLVLYAAAKGAIDSFTIGLAKEVADAGIRVNAVRAGIIDTEAQDVQGAEILARITRTVPMNRAGLPEEVANATLFLLSEQASYITGTFINVSGGR